MEITENPQGNTSKNSNELLSNIEDKSDKSINSFKKPLLIGKIGKLPRKLVDTKDSTENDKDQSNTGELNSTAETNNDKALVQETPKIEEQPIKSPAQHLAENVSILPYKEPVWSGLPHSSGKPYIFEVLKAGVIVKQISLMERPFWVFGRSPHCEIYMTNPTVSRHHAILQFRKEAEDGNPRGFYIYDLNSTHGTFLNKGKLKPRVYAPVKVGHMVKLGFSTCSYILTGPEEDAEEESEFTVTELKRQRAEKLLKQEVAKKEAEKAIEEQRKREENRGVDWGLGEDADEETDLSENPYAQTNNEDLYINDPKKALRGFMEREGQDLFYDCMEQGFGQFICKVELPIDDDYGKPIVAEVLHKGKKREAVVLCALEACKILDRYGLLKQATHESRKRKTKNWEENDYYDSDEDTFLDRTGSIEKKREKRMRLKVPQQPETYQSLMEKQKKICDKISQTENQLSEARSSSSSEASRGDEDSLDSYMKALKNPKVDKQTISKLKSELASLKAEQINVIKLINLAKPADLPPLVIRDDASEQGTSQSIKSKMLPVFNKHSRTKVQLPSETTTKSNSDNMSNSEEEEEEEEERQVKPRNVRHSAQNSKPEQTESNDFSHKKIYFKVAELDKLLTNTTFPSIFNIYLVEMGEVLDKVKDLISYEGRIQTDKKIVMAKNRKIRKRVDDLLENFNEDYLLGICKECQRLCIEIQDIAVKQHSVYSKIRILGKKIDILCKEILRKVDEIKSNKQSVVDKNQDKEQQQSSQNSSAEGIEHSDEEDDKQLTQEELEKRKKRNQRRLQNRRERAELEKQKGYKEDAQREDYNMWVPPQNQTGDGRTRLNEKFGY